MAENLHLVLNERGRVYNLKHTNMQDKLWVCRRVKKGCRGSIFTNLDVDAVLDCNPHADDCTPDNNILYKMEKKNSLKRRAAEELKTIPQIYHEEASSASADLETAGQFPTYKSVKTAMYRKRAKKFPRLPPTRQQLEIPLHWRMTKSDRRFLLYNNVYNSILIFCTEENLSILSEHSVWSMDGTFKIVPEWYQQMFTIHVFIAGKLVPLVYCLTVHKDLSTYREIFDNLILKAAALGVVLQPQTVICDFETALIPALQGTFPGVNIQGCYFHFCQAVLRKVNVELLSRDATGSIAALFNYFRVEWIPPDRLLMCNVYNVNIRTNNDLEGWHFKMNRLAGKRHLGFYELLQLLIDEQGSTETLIQQVTSGRVTASDLQIKNKKYEELQQRITALTAEYDGGTRTLEQFLRAVAYLLLIPLRYNLECTIHAPGSTGCQQSNVVTRSKDQDVPRCTLPQ
ncbi:hypothetical protein T03_1233 [Trichinella britovi]|uniref:MULE transposase domain-containing protein n=1 Tax=Trichinella britovi TaxID=45882 RepID=A0A0V1C7D2_TRIBR|nr:hypothetical protein T03_1233 [Trichinella britovi]